MKEIIDFQPTPDTDTAHGIGKPVLENVLAKQKELIAAELPPAPTDGTPDVFGALRVWVSKETGQFTGDRHHHQPDDPGYNGQQER